MSNDELRTELTKAIADFYQAKNEGNVSASEGFIRIPSCLMLSVEGDRSIVQADLAKFGILVSVQEGYNDATNKLVSINLNQENIAEGIQKIKAETEIIKSGAASANVAPADNLAPATIDDYFTAIKVAIHDHPNLAPLLQKELENLTNKIPLLDMEYEGKIFSGEIVPEVARKS